MEKQKPSKISIQTLKTLSDSNAYQIYKIHYNSLPDDVMPNFGYKVEKKYLAKLNKENNGATIVALADDTIVGFLLLRFKTLDMKEFLNTSSIFVFLSKALLKPKIIVRLIYQLRHPTPNITKSCEIDYFAVSEKLRGQNIGKKLLKKAEELALENKCKSISTKTNNTNLYSFYTKKKNASLIHSFKVLNSEYFYINWNVQQKTHQK